MSLILSMTMSGSIVFLLYLLAKPVSNHYLTAHWQYKFLKFNILFYLVPYQYFKNEYFIFYNRIFGTGEAVNPLYTGIIHYNPNRVIYYMTDTGKIYFKHQTLLLAGTILWLCTISILLCCQTTKYLACRKRLLLLSRIPDYSTLKAALHYCDSILPCYRKKQKILLCPHIKSPFAIGLFWPLIILPIPESSEDPETSSLYLMHELYHIKNHDAFWKMIAFLVILIHWYNPLIYLFFLELCSVCEKSCDEKVIAPLTESQRLHYGNIIIDAAQQQNCTNFLFADSFSRNKRQAKERILFMTKKQPQATHWKLITIIAISLIILLTPLSVLAYTPVTFSIDSDYEIGLQADRDCLIPEGTENPYADKTLIIHDYTLSDEIFIDEFGNQYAITPNSTDYTRSCTHEYKSGTKLIHSKSGAGCTEYEYQGIYCIKCGLCQSQKLLRQVTYPECPH